MNKSIPLFPPSYLSVMVGCLLLQTAYASPVEETKDTALDEQLTHPVNSNPKVDVENNGSEDYVFDTNMLKGRGLSAAMVERFNRMDSVQAGTYKVDIYVNEQFVERRNIRFLEDNQTKQGVVACLSPELIEKAGILGDAAYQEQKQTISATNDCLTLAQVATGGSIYFDFSRLRLNLSVPQVLMRKVPRGYVNPSELNAGASIGFINYTGNYYYTESNTNHDFNNESAFMSFNGGINFGKWQYRQQSSLSMNNDHETHWQNIRSYVQRPIDKLQSQLTLGQIYTSGQFFSGMPFYGINLATDQRMRPESLRGYAPVIRGIAQSNAKVSVRQNGNEIYQIAVAAGAFEINDLYPTNYEGDLTVVVTEADGSQHSTVVPYAAVPSSLREGLSNYSISFGQTYQEYLKDSYFTDVNYELGLNNAITLNSGVRLANNYQAYALGGVYGSSMGALGSQITYSHAKLPTVSGNDSLDGWMANLTYSKTLNPTNTMISLAGYRYSTEGYRDLTDVLGIRQSYENGNIWLSSSYLQRSRFQVSASQPLGNYGSLYVSGSTSDYRDGRNRDTTFQAGYSKSFGIVNMNLNYSRQKVHTVQGDTVIQERFDNFGGLSISIPLGSNRSRLTPNLNASYNRSNNSDNYQVGVSGALDEDYSLSYSLGVNGTSASSEQQTYNAGLFKRFPNVSLGLNTAYNDQYWQGSLNATGAVAIHGGGVTFGPYVGETFALIEAKDAKGAKVVGSSESRIDRFGYALMSSLTPYRYNNIALDPVGTATNVEIDSGEQRIAPYAGATMKVKFKTRTGYNVLIQSHLVNGQNIPMGADVLTEAGDTIGMVGQANQVYVRVEQQQGQLVLRWGNDAGQSCKLPYQIPSQQLTHPLIKLQAQCIMESE